jgi:hypothetical protein
MTKCIKDGWGGRCPDCDGVSCKPKEVPTMDINSTRAIVIAALYDFAARLTTQPGTLKVGSTHDAAPMAQAVKEFTVLRSLDSDAYSDPPIKDWRVRLGTRELTELAFEDPQPEGTFEQELAKLLNRFSMDNYTGTPDFVLAKLVGAYLDGLNIREKLMKDVSLPPHMNTVVVVNEPSSVVKALVGDEARRLPLVLDREAFLRP